MGVFRPENTGGSGLGVGLALVCASVGLSLPARAACPVALVAPRPDVAWEGAVEALRARVVADDARDCGSIEVEVTRQGTALLTFVTKDGRRAARGLATADEALPTLEALLAVPASTPALPLDDGPPRVPPPPPRADAPPSGAVPSGPPAVWSVAAGAGARFGFSGAYGSPAFALRPSVLVGRWEVSVSGEWAPSSSYLPGGAPAGFSAWSFHVGFLLARRQPVGPVELVGGLGLGVAAVRESADPAPDGTARSLETAQPRATLDLRCIFGRSRVRPLFEISADTVLGALARQGSDKRDLPDLPRYGLVAALGVEARLLP